MKRVIAGLLAVLGLLASPMALATPISGSAGFNGVYVQNGGTFADLTTATSFTITSINGVTGTGDLSGILLAGATFASPIGVNGNGPSLVGVTLWTASDGGQTFSFVVSSETQVFANASTLVVQGSGTMSSTSSLYDPTAGTWQISFGVSGAGTNASFTWQATSASTGRTVPEPATLALLGLGLLGMGVVRRARQS